MQHATHWRHPDGVVHVVARKGKTTFGHTCVDTACGREYTRAGPRSLHDFEYTDEAPTCLTCVCVPHGTIATTWSTP